MCSDMTYIKFMTVALWWGVSRRRLTKQTSTWAIIFILSIVLCNKYGYILEKAMAPHSSTLAWKIPWTEEPGRLQSMGSRRVRHDWATSLSLSRIGEGNGNPLQCSCLQNPRDGVAWWADVYGVAQSQMQLKRLSSSSSNFLLFQVLGFWGISLFLAALVGGRLRGESWGHF